MMSSHPDVSLHPMARKSGLIFPYHCEPDFTRQVFDGAATVGRDFHVVDRMSL